MENPSIQSANPVQPENPPQASADGDFTADEIMAEYEKDLMEDEAFRKSELEKHPHLLLPETFTKSYSETLTAISPDRVSEKLTTSEKALLESSRKSSKEMPSKSSRDKPSKSASATSESWLLEAKSSKKSFQKSGKSSAATDAAIFPKMTARKPATVTSASASASLEAEIPSSFPPLSRNFSGK